MKKVSLILSAVLITTMVVTSCGGVESKEVAASNVEAITNEVSIGKQVWMTENLNVDKFRNGDSILEAKTDEEWRKAGENGQPAWCYYNNNPDNGDRYGKLYNWYAVNDQRGLAPEGLRIPTIEDWSRLIDFLGGKEIAEEKMKFTEFWADNNGKSGNGTNESGFSALPGGYRAGIRSSREFSGIGGSGIWWSSSDHENTLEWPIYINFPYGLSIGEFCDHTNGFSVRCLKD